MYIKESMKNKPLLLDYTIVFLFICISGNPFFCYWSLSSAVLLFICICCFISNHNFSLLKFIESIKLYLLLFISLFCAQNLICDNISISTQINYLVKILGAALIYYYYNERFRNIYLNIITFISIVSLIGYIYILMGGEIPNIFGKGFANSDSIHTVIIYNYDINFNFGRNSGMFWEPGAFACYLLVTPLFFIDNILLFVKNNKWKVLFLICALITTFSTTGYLMLSLYGYLYFKNKYKYSGSIFGIIILLLIVSTDVVQMKLEKDLSTVEDVSIGEEILYDGYNSANRLGSIFFLLNIIKDHPFVGNGINPEALFANNKYLLSIENLGIGNGFFMYIANLGIGGLMIYFLKIWKNWKNIGTKRFWVLVIITLLLQGEPLLMYPIFIGLPFFISNPNNNLHYDKTNRLLKVYSRRKL